MLVRGVPKNGDIHYAADQVVEAAELADQVVEAELAADHEELASAESDHVMGEDPSKT